MSKRYRPNPFWLFAIAIGLSLACMVLCESCKGQNYQPHSKMASTSKLPDGNHFVLVSADWCLPCKQLKQQLQAFPNTKIYTLDFGDSELSPERVRASAVIDTRLGIPQLIRYEVANGNFVTSKWNPAMPLESFLVQPVPVQSPIQSKIIEPTPLTGPFDAIVKRLENRTLKAEKKAESVSEQLAMEAKRWNDSSSIFDGRLSRLREEFQSYSLEAEGFFGRIAEAAKERANIFQRLNEMADERQGMVAKLRDAVSEIATFRSERDAERVERQGVLSKIKSVAEQVASSREERKLLRGEITELNRERKGLLAQLAEARTERIKARADREGILKKITEYRKENGTLASRIAWLAISLCGSVVLLILTVTWVYGKFRNLTLGGTT